MLVLLNAAKRNDASSAEALKDGNYLLILINVLYVKRTRRRGCV